MLFYCETEIGCRILEEKNLESAKERMRKEVGQSLRMVRKATDKDIAWVGGMGGFLPESARIKKIIL